MDQPSNPSFGSWADRERENSAGSTHGNSPSSSAQQQQAATEAAQRSFSSILSPTLPTTNSRKEEQDPLAKPFVYSREFLLSLYDDDKARRRPIELAVNEIATKDQGNGGGKPWALRDMRDGEKEVRYQFPSPLSGMGVQEGRRPYGMSACTLLHLLPSFSSSARPAVTSPSEAKLTLLSLTAALRSIDPPSRLTRPLPARSSPQRWQRRLERSRRRGLRRLPLPRAP